jgi:hypothetical protein
LDRSRGFQIGGVIKQSSTDPARTLSCDHGYMEYSILWEPRKTSIVMWHSSITYVWQNRWDGGEDLKDMFLRRDYPVYLWDGPRVGRANWAYKPTSYTLEVFSAPPPSSVLSRLPLLLLPPYSHCVPHTPNRHCRVDNSTAKQVSYLQSSELLPIK